MPFGLSPKGAAISTDLQWYVVVHDTGTHAGTFVFGPYATSFEAADYLAGAIAHEIIGGEDEYSIRRLTATGARAEDSEGEIRKLR